MSDLPANRSSSFDNISSRILKHNVTLPKSQPVHLKALMLESDEEDDNDDKIEEKAYKSESESDSDDSQSVPQNDCTKDILQISSQKKKDTNSVSHLEEGTNSSIQKESCTNSKKENKLGFVSSEVNVVIGNTSKEDSHSCKFEKIPEKHSDMCALESPKVSSLERLEIDTVCDDSTDVMLQSSLSSSSVLYTAHKSYCNTHFGTYKNMQSSTSMHQIENILSKKNEEHAYSTSIENKMLLQNSNELNLSKGDQQYKTHGFIEQSSKDYKDELHKVPNTVLESGSCAPQTSGSVMHFTRYNSQYSNAKDETNEKFTPAKSACTPSLSEMGKSLTAMNLLMAETPLKSLHGSVHPNSSTSHKQLFRTPQSKLSSEPSKSNVQTPSTIFSTWCHNTMRQTPIEGKNFTTKDHVQTLRVCTPIIEKPEPMRLVIHFILFFKKHTACHTLHCSTISEC